MSNKQTSEVRAVLADPGASDWLKTALTTALDRDPVDATNDAEILAGLLARNLDLIFSLHGQ